MCMFSGRAEVAGTRIYARRDGAEQLLAYEMEFASAGDVAMVLPLPVAPGAGEGAVRFIDLSSRPRFFDTLAALFPVDLELSRGPVARSLQSLAVHRVGEFEASYVPSIPDFARLDERFRIPANVWDALPGYGDFGFAVFKLAHPVQPAPAGLLERVGLRRRPQAPPQRVHPMAFAFRTRLAEQLFFPTVHVHDGAVHRQAHFDHELYRQGGLPRGWEASERPPSAGESERSGGLLVEDTVWRREMQGTYDNADVYA